MKYKLINSVSKIETICDKVTIDGFDYYVSDEKPKLGEFYLDDINQIRQSVTDDEEYWDRRNGYKVIITCNNPNIDIPKVVNEVEKLSFEFCEDKWEYVIEENRESFEAGYNKSQETHPFSEKDMIDFTKWLVKRLEPKYDCDTTMNFIPQVMIHGEEQVWTKGNEMITKFYTTKEVLKLWKEQQPKIVYYG